MDRTAQRGYDKGSEYTEWINSFDGKVKKLILLGDTKEKIAADAEKCGFKDYMFVDSFEEAVLTAAKIAAPIAGVWRYGDTMICLPNTSA